MNGLIRISALITVSVLDEQAEPTMLYGRGQQIMIRHGPERESHAAGGFTVDESCGFPSVTLPTCGSSCIVFRDPFPVEDLHADSTEQEWTSCVPASYIVIIHCP
jgi:hypothetical protein